MLQPISMSVRRDYAQRNNNNTKIVPQINSVINTSQGPGFELTEVAVYQLTLPNVQNSGGIFYIDLSAPDVSGNLLNFDGEITTNNGPPVRMIAFNINIPFNAPRAPGLEFTIFFKNIPTDIFPPPFPLFTIGIMGAEGAPWPYMVSPPVPWITAPGINNSVTFKSDGENYNATSSGPAGWLGIVALSTLLNSIGAP
jgi:hypothetical protein